jgi:hypothetical protein
LGEQNQCIKYKVCDFESQIVVAKNCPSFYYWSSQEEKECSSMLFVILWDSNGIQKDFHIFFSFRKFAGFKGSELFFGNFLAFDIFFPKLLFGCFGEFWN